MKTKSTRGHKIGKWKRKMNLINFWYMCNEGSVICSLLLLGVVVATFYIANYCPDCADKKEYKKICEPYNPDKELYEFDMYLRGVIETYVCENDTHTKLCETNVGSCKYEEKTKTRIKDVCYFCLKSQHREWGCSNDYRKKIEIGGSAMC